MEEKENKEKGKNTENKMRKGIWNTETDKSMKRKNRCGKSRKMRRKAKEEKQRKCSLFSHQNRSVLQNIAVL